jgi:hypothetical protein
MTGDQGGFSSGIDWTGVFGIDSGTMKRYVWVSGEPISGEYSVGAPGVLNVEASAPTFSGYQTNDDQEPCTISDSHCISSQMFTHTALFRDKSGKAQFYNRFYEIQGNQVYGAFSAMASTSKSFRMAEEGGGMYFSQIIPWDEQPGMSDTIGGIVTAPMGQGATLFAAQITSITAANPPIITIANTLSGSTHLVRVDGGTGGWACANGYWTAAVNSTTITLTGATCISAGSFAGQTMLIGDSLNDIQHGQQSTLGQIIVIVPGHTVKQIAMHRSVSWPNIGSVLLNYYTMPRSSLSRDGSMVAWSSNFGTIDPAGTSVYISYKGLGASKTGISGKGVVTGAGAVR